MRDNDWVLEEYMEALHALQPEEYLEYTDPIQQTGVAAYVNRQAGLVLAGARKGGVAQGVVVGGCVALARTLAAGYLLALSLCWPASLADYAG